MSEEAASLIQGQRKIADISKYQGKVDWKAASGELLFCILRASIGHSEDSEYSANVKGCRENHIPFGAYHYVKAGTREEAEKEARIFLEVTGGAEEAPLFYFADIEAPAQTKETTEEVCTAFAYTLRAFGCAKIGLYINSKYHWAGEALLLYDMIWIPHWGKNDGQIPGREYEPKHPCDLWQYTSKGRLAGVKGDVDLSSLYGGREAAFFIDGYTPKEREEKMGYDRNAVIQLARSEVGYLEKKSPAQLDDKTANAGSNNYTKYARDMDAIPGFYNGKKQGAAWCDVFVDWLFVQAFGIDAGRALLCQPMKSAGAGCKYSRRYYQEKGRLFDTGQPGDQIFFYPSNGIGGSAIQHTGLVVAADDQYYYTIEGNTSNKSGVIANGGGVWEKQYARNYARLAGFGRPDWGAEDVTPTPAQPTPEPPQDAPETPEKRVIVTNPKGRKVNIRQGNGTAFSSVALLSPGTVLEYVATAANGWHAVVYKKCVAWISGEYAEVRG